MNLLQNDSQYIWHPFRQEKNALPLLPIISGKGSVLYAEDGREYLDLVSSWWVNTHGHAHPKIAKAIGDQANQLEQVLFSDATHPGAVRVAQKLNELLPPSLTRVFFSDNGSTAVEIALKMAYQYWYNKGQTKRNRFLAFQGGYHGDTFGAMSAGKSSGFYKPFNQFLFQVDFLPFPETWDSDDDIEHKEQEALNQLDTYLSEHAQETVALVMEPLIQGASGMRFCRPIFMQKLAKKLRSHGILLIFDEVMTGFGRTGSLFSCQKAGVTPDIICLAKGLTGGFLPLAVTVATKEIYDAFLGDTFDKAFAHGHSFAANPLGCAAAVACLSLFEEEMTLNAIHKIEQIHRDQINILVKKHPEISRSRVMGSIAAFNLTVPGEQGYTSTIGRTLKESFFARGLFLRPLGSVIYLMPPYCTTEEQLVHAYKQIHEVLMEIRTSS